VRDYGLDKEISLPRIAVLGTQSSGKSSLLENIVGLDFLPRGSGVVTRRPLELRLVHMDPSKTYHNQGHSDGKPYAVFEGDTTSRKYSDFSAVRDNIQKLTDDVAGTSGNIVNDPIKLRIYSVDCPDLTIIDLPGITRIDIRGQTNIEKVTTEMAKQYKDIVT
jgi:GTPase SAR1 family protein